MATETLYYNFDDPTELHDYRYFGENYREREDYKVKRKNLVNKFKRMTSLERSYFFDAIQDLATDNNPVGAAPSKSTIPEKSASNQAIHGAIHKIGNLTVQWAFGDKLKICYPNQPPLWTNDFSVVRDELKKYVDNSEIDRTHEIGYVR